MAGRRMYVGCFHVKADGGVVVPNVTAANVKQPDPLVLSLALIPLYLLCRIVGQLSLLGLRS